jgi:hypothetical protein
MSIIEKKNLNFEKSKVKKLSNGYIENIVSNSFISFNEINNICKEHNLRVYKRTKCTVKGETKKTQYYRLIIKNN